MKRWILPAFTAGVVVSSSACVSIDFFGSDSTERSEVHEPGAANSDAQATREPAAFDTRDQWGPNIVLRDNTETFPKDKPAGGWWVTAVQADLIPATGEVLLTGWGLRDPNRCHVTDGPQYNKGEPGSRRNGTSFILHPAQLDVVARSPRRVYMVQPVPEQARKPGEGLYNSGHTQTPDGRIMFVGGSRYEDAGQANEKEWGVDYLRVFDRTVPRANQAFMRVEPGLKGGPKIRGETRANDAWAATATRLPDGKALITAGFAQCCERGPTGFKPVPNNSMHLFSASRSGGAVMTLVPHEQSRAEISPGVRDHTHQHLLAKPIIAGGERFDVALMGFKGELVYFSVGLRRFMQAPEGQRRAAGAIAAGWNSTSALLPSGEILVFGGTSDPRTAQSATIYNPEPEARGSRWRTVDTGIGRQNAASVLLPDGNVLIVNGWADRQRGMAGDRRRPVILDPEQGAVVEPPLRPWEDDVLERGYNSFALLLKDGRVLIGGGTHEPRGPVPGEDLGCERPDIRVYSPPYLAGERPRLAGFREGSRIEAGGPSFKLKLAGGGPFHATRGVALMAPGAFTRGFDQNQRYIRLKYKLEENGTAAVVQPPENPVQAPPGHYLLFALNEAGVPSAGQWVIVR